MLKNLEELKNTPRLRIEGILDLLGTTAYSGWVELLDGFKGTVVFGYNEEGWEHVSVSHINPNKMPTWENMATIKNMFWEKTDTVVQIHPSEGHYFHGFKGRPNILHLWRPVDGDWSIMERGTDK